MLINRGKLMQKRTIFMLSILSTFLFLMLPQIQAVDYNLVKENAIQSFKQSLQIDDGIKTEKISSFLNQLSSRSDILRTKLNVNSIFSSIIKFILSILALILNVLLSVINIIGGLVKTVFNVTVNLIVGLLKKILGFGLILQKVLDIFASVITGLFSIILDIILGILTIAIDIIVHLITPNESLSY